MTIEIKVECDAHGCSNETEIRDNHDSDVESEGWVVDPDDGFQHFCPSCWPKIKEEIELDEIEKEDQDTHY